MCRIRALPSLSAALLLACLGVAQAADPVIVEGMTVAESGGRTKAMIAVPDGVEYSVFTLVNPNRLVLDLHDSRFGSRFRVPGPDGVIANVRTGQPSPGDARVVFDLSATVRPRSYFQTLNGYSQLVIEMLGSADKATPDPVVAVLSVQPPHVAVPGNANVPTKSADVVAMLPAPKQVKADDSRRANPKVDSPVTIAANATIQHLDAASVAGTKPDAANANAHRGARTMRDVLGAGQRKLIIAVDAGHGGQDCGAKGYSGTYEKNVTLATARELARQINAEPGMQAVLTRDGDYFVPLVERYRKAREAKADLFISIHADADPTHSATGSSVWVLSQRGVTSQAARWLADRENAADLIGGVSLSDKDDTLASVLLDLSQSATMKASDDAAERVHQALRDIGRTHKSHPEHANFVVLRSPDVPSMLVETAFITNAGEEKHLNDPDYRSRLAGAVLSGVRSYFIDNPLPDTQFAALHAPRTHRDANGLASAAPAVQMVADVAPMRAANTDNDTVPASMAMPLQLASADDARRYHVVKRGETLSDIADQYGVSLLRLRTLNDIQGNRVLAGQRLRIPQRSGAG
ncbi:MAG: N-acetylmuramoyl-L-alanine amidase [Lysobacteraceae bacterium]